MNRHGTGGETSEGKADRAGKRNNKSRDGCLPGVAEAEALSFEKYGLSMGGEGFTEHRLGLDEGVESGGSGCNEGAVPSKGGRGVVGVTVEVDIRREQMGKGLLYTRLENGATCLSITKASGKTGSVRVEAGGLGGEEFSGKVGTADRLAQEARARDDFGTRGKHGKGGAKGNGVRVGEKRNRSDAQRGGKDFCLGPIDNNAMRRAQGGKAGEEKGEVGVRKGNRRIVKVGAGAGSGPKGVVAGGSSLEAQGSGENEARVGRDAGS